MSETLTWAEEFSYGKEMFVSERISRLQEKINSHKDIEFCNKHKHIFDTLLKLLSNERRDLDYLVLLRYHHAIAAAFLLTWKLDREYRYIQRCSQREKLEYDRRMRDNQASILEIVKINNTIKKTMDFRGGYNGLAGIIRDVEQDPILLSHRCVH